MLKAASFGRRWNVTLGLPFIRTSVDHGTALDLAPTRRRCRGRGSGQPDRRRGSRDRIVRTRGNALAFPERRGHKRKSTSRGAALAKFPRRPHYIARIVDAVAPHRATAWSRSGRGSPL